VGCESALLRFERTGRRQLRSDKYPSTSLQISPRAKSSPLKFHARSNATSGHMGVSTAKDSSSSAFRMALLPRRRSAPAHPLTPWSASREKGLFVHVCCAAIQRSSVQANDPIAPGASSAEPSVCMMLSKMSRPGCRASLHKAPCQRELAN